MNVKTRGGGGLALRSQAPRGVGGFTLLELILVMIVIFTLATVVAPRFSDFFPSFQVRKNSEHLLAWARKARADAATTGRRQRLILDTQLRKYWIEFEPRPIKEPGTFRPLGGSWTEEQLPEAVVFETISGAETDPTRSSFRYIEFRPDGTSTEATIILSNGNGDKSTLRVEGATSRVFIEAAPEEKP